MAETSWLEIDLSALDHNLQAFRNLIGSSCRLSAVVKADAYGLGALPIAKRLVANGVDLLTVYSTDQAAQLAQAGLPASLLILMPIERLDRTDILYRTAVAGRLHLTAQSTEHLDQLEAIGQTFGTRLMVHLELDTGMSRMGMSLEEAHRVLSTLAQRRYLQLAGIFTHAASADTDPDYTDLQLQHLEEFIEAHQDKIGKDVLIHFGATLASLRNPRYHKHMVRIGLGLLGYGAHRLDQPDLPELRPLVRWISRIIHIHDVPAGARVGYDGCFVTDRPTRLGIVPAGYADGYPLVLTNRGQVRVGDQLALAPVRGKVNMDQLIIDLTDLPEAGLNTPVELISSDPEAPNALHRVAEAAHSSCYEMLCRLSPRLKRRYVTTHQNTGQVGHVMTVEGQFRRQQMQGVTGLRSAAG